MTNIAYFADKTQDNRHTDPLTTARQLVEDIENGTVNPDALLIISVHKDENHFHIGYRLARLRMSEVITAVELMKARAITALGYVYGPDSD